MTNKLPSLYQEIIHRSRYSRYLPEQQRRETWEETVDRLIDYFHTKIDLMDLEQEDKQYIKEILG